MGTPTLGLPFFLLAQPSRCYTGVRQNGQSSETGSQEDEDRWSRQEGTNLGRIVENESGEEEDTEVDEDGGDERDIWSVSTVTEEDFETTEGEVEDLYDKLMEMMGWKVTDNENENENDLILV